jgi:hypothetical protein
MKKLLVEFLQNIIGEAGPTIEDPELPYTDAKGKTRKAKASTLATYEKNHPGRIAYDRWAASKKKPAAPKAAPPQKKATTPEEPVAKKSAKPRAPRTKRAKIEKTPSDRKQVVSSFGKTTLDIEGLVRAVEGVESQVAGEKGAGTKASTAGEAATTLGLERLRQLRTQQPNSSTNDFLKQNMPEVVKMLSELRGVKGSALTEDWAEAARKQVMAMFGTIEGKYKVKISEIGWDNATGRKALGLGSKPKSDRSDLYVKGSDGQIIGISLKKDGNIFLANQGLQTVLDSIAEKAPNEETATKIRGVSNTHKQTFEQELEKLLVLSNKDKTKIVPYLQQLTRDNIEDVDSAKYDAFFDKNGKLNKEALDLLTTGGIGRGMTKKGPKKYNPEERKLFLKTMAALSETVPPVRTALENMRAADRKATHALLELVRNDDGVNETMTDYLIDSLDLAQLVTQGRPFGEDYPVDKFFIAYGEANLQPDGEEFPMSVTRDTILSTLDLPTNITDEELKKAVKEKFVVDADDGARVGFLRLRIKNQTPPPNYFYPSISTLGIRARGLGAAPTMELAQHSGWTYTLLNKSPNPENWPPHHRYAQAEDSMLFLMRQAKNPLLTDQQKAEIEKDIEFYKQQMRV